MSISVITPATSEPLTTAEVKSFLRVDSSDEDTLIGVLITAARSMAEAYTRRILMTTTIEEFYDVFPNYRNPEDKDIIFLSRGPIQSVTSVKYVDGAGDEQTISSANYATDLVSEPSRIVSNNGWYATKDTVNAVIVRYVCGYSSSSDVPAPIRQAMLLMIAEMFRKPTKWSVMKQLILKDIEDLIIGSLGIVAFISFFVGGVITIQTALNIDNPLIPRYLVGFATRQSIILEFAPTFISVIMAGKVGSFITSSIGTMRVTEQIDALEVMGINSVNYLVFPKTVALLLYPFVISIAMFLGIIGGMAACVFGGYSTFEDYVTGVQMDFMPFHMVYAFIKTLVFAFLLATIPSFHGYYMKGGALEVGKASTTAFVWTSVAIILLNYILTQMLLS